MAGKSCAVPLSQHGDAALPASARELLTKARTTWLRNTEVLQILTTYAQYFVVSTDPPDRPAGSVPPLYFGPWQGLPS